MKALQDHKVPLFVIEEHNEAFFVWIDHLRKNGLPRKGYTLWHFDDHSDMTTLRVNTPLHDVFNWSYEKLYRFTYDELTIASFIMTGGFVGLFKHIVWCKQDHNYTNKTDLFITSYNNDGKNLISGRQINDNPLLSNEHKIIQYSKTTPSQFLPDGNKRILLDIDLDYFSCNVSPENNNEIVLEITEQEYEEFISNKYHPIRFICNTVITKVVDGSYYLIINYYRDIFPSPRKVSEEIILERIDKLITLLRNTRVTPSLITVCRSVKSGYTPKDQWQFIEKKLLSGLKELYGVEQPIFI